MKKKSVLFLAALMSMVLFACGSSSEKIEDTKGTDISHEEAESKSSKEKLKDTFVLGFDQEFPPMGFMGDNGEYTGFDIELGENVSKRLGLKFVPQPINWDAKDMELNSGNIDCIWNGFTMEGREDKYDFVGPYMANEQIFVVRNDSDINDIADLAGKAIEVQKDSSGLAALSEDNNKELLDSFSSLTQIADYNLALMDLETGACDAVCMDIVVAAYQIRSSGKDLRILDGSIANEGYGIGFKKGNDELVSKVRDTLMEMREDGTLKEISEKWFGKDVTKINN